MDEIILVNAQDEEIGVAQKLHAHQYGLLHRAFSVFIFNVSGENTEVLLQQRQPNKYHSGGLWTNTCCSHPLKGEMTIKAARRRLQEEMGIDTTLIEAGSFHYRAQFDNGLIENEIDHVFVGFMDKIEPKFNTDEVADYQWLAVTSLVNELKQSPEKFTYWFEQALDYALTDKRLPVDIRRNSNG